MHAEQQLETYRNLITLKDGARILLRPLMRDDQQRLADMFAPVPPEDARYLRDDVARPETVLRWVESLDYARVLPVVAVFHDRIVGDATLHFRSGPARHIGEVRIFLAKDFRRRGLGTHMIRTVIELARKAGLHLLVAEIVADQTRVIKAFQNLGFQLHATFEDFYMFPDGETADTVLLTMRLLQREDEF